MTCVDIDPEGHHGVAPAPPSAGRWWRWLAAAAVMAPAGGLPHHLLTIAEENPAPRCPTVPISRAA